VSEDYLLIPKKELLALSSLLQELADLHGSIMSKAGTATLRFIRDAVAEDQSATERQADRLATATKPETAGEGNGDRDPISGRYIIRPGGLSYADVVDLEVRQNVFSLDQAWTTIKDKIVTKSHRARESMRRALDGDQRFGRGRSNLYVRREAKPEYDGTDALPF
jgi:hypothetical protein